MSKKKKGTKQKPYDGQEFEKAFVEKMNDYMHHHSIRGLAYLYPYKKGEPQAIDILLDSNMLGFCGIECKSMNEKAIQNGKIELSRLNRPNIHTHNTQVFNQHKFLKSTCRYGMVAIEFRICGDIYLLPHQIFYNYIADGIEYMRVKDLISYSYKLYGPGDLATFIKNKCQVIG